MLPSWQKCRLNAVYVVTSDICPKKVQNVDAAHDFGLPYMQKNSNQEKPHKEAHVSIICIYPWIPHWKI